jgi:hypothetical protein
VVRYRNRFGLVGGIAAVQDLLHPLEDEQQAALSVARETGEIVQ